MNKRRQPATLPHSRVQRLALEPRIVFDGALPVATIEAVDHGADHGYVAPPAITPVQRDAEQAKPFPLAVAQDKSVAMGDKPGSAHEIIFVDASVAGLQALLNEHQQAEVIVLDPHRDGVEQIATALAGRTGVDAIHILSHGDAGKLHLGDATLDQQGINGQYADELAVIRSALTDNADILIYGCDVAAGSKGQAFVTALAAATGADIAASINSTGAVSRGGDWVLESTTGAIEATALTLDSFDGVLTTAPTITDSVTVARTTTEDTALVITGVTVADADNPASMSAALNVTGGAINLAGSGWTVTAGTNGTSAVTVTGTVAQINAALNGMSFIPTLNQNAGIAGYAPKIDITVRDLTNTDGPTVLSITNLLVSAVNDAPTLSGGAGATVAEGGVLNFSSAVTVGQGFNQSQLGLADVDNSAVQVIVKIAGLPAHGTLKLNGNPIALGSTFSVADIGNFSYTHDGSQVTSLATDTFLVTIDDGAGALLVNRPVSVSITPVNQPPSVSGSITVIEGETGVRLDNNGILPTLATPRGAIVTSDPEGAAISSYSITSLPGHGTLYYNGILIASATPALPFVASDITKLTYSHDGSNTTADSFNISVTDNGGGTATPATTSGTVNLTIHPNDDDPVLTTDLTQTMAAATSSLTITPAMLRVTDSDSPDATLTYTLTSVPASAPSMGAVLEVKVLPRADHSERSEAQLREGDRAWEGSGERIRESRNTKRI